LFSSCTLLVSFKKYGSLVRSSIVILFEEETLSNPAITRFAASLHIIDSLGNEYLAYVIFLFKSSSKLAVNGIFPVRRANITTPKAHISAGFP
jgi:hypothetical protein